MKKGVPKEIAAVERRVALTPDAVTRLIKAGTEVLLESGAGREALISDQAYLAAGASVVDDAETLYGSVEVVL